LPKHAILALFLSFMKRIINNKECNICPHSNLQDVNLYNANLRNANLRDADLRDADLRDAELNRALFYGRGGTKELKKSQLPDFLAALGFVIVD